MSCTCICFATLICNCRYSLLTWKRKFVSAVTPVLGKVTNCFKSRLNKHGLFSPYFISMLFNEQWAPGWTPRPTIMGADGWCFRGPSYRRGVLWYRLTLQKNLQVFCYTDTELANKEIQITCKYIYFVVLYLFHRVRKYS